MKRLAWRGTPVTRPPHRRTSSHSLALGGSLAGEMNIVGWSANSVPWYCPADRWRSWRQSCGQRHRVGPERSCRELTPSWGWRVARPVNPESEDPEQVAAQTRTFSEANCRQSRTGERGSGPELSALWPSCRGLPAAQQREHGVHASRHRPTRTSRAACHRPGRAPHAAPRSTRENQAEPLTPPGAWLGGMRAQGCWGQREAFGPGMRGEDPNCNGASVRLPAAGSPRADLRPRRDSDGRAQAAPVRTLHSGLRPFPLRPACPSYCRANASRKAAHREGGEKHSRGPSANCTPTAAHVRNHDSSTARSRVPDAAEAEEPGLRGIGPACARDGVGGREGDTMTKRGAPSRQILPLPPTL